MSYNFMTTWQDLDNLYESKACRKKPTLTEGKYYEAKPINLADCRMITSDVIDSRGEYEASACLEYNNELTRVQVRIVIIRDTENGKEFLGKPGRTRVRLPGGGYDMDKDNTIVDTAKREALEEFNLVLTNLKEANIRIWSHRKDSWVAKHVANEENRWTGYYTYYVFAEVQGEGNNDRPDERGKWIWLPLEDLSRVNSKLPACLDNLQEAIHPDREPRNPKVKNISYLCDSLSTLRKILSNMEIQKTYVSEVRYEVGEHNGNTQAIRQKSLSTSTKLVGHAYRRPDKWGFGVILDGAELSRYYDIEPYSHADHKLSSLFISKIVKLRTGAYRNATLIVGLGEYGNRIIRSDGNADKELYDILIDFLNNSKYKETANTLTTGGYILKSDPNNWARHPFGNKDNPRWSDSRFTHLEVRDVEELYVWKSPYSKNAIPLRAIKEYNEENYKKLIQIFKKYTSFEENEERIWVENNLMNYIQIPPSTLKGIILPDYFKDDYESEFSENNHITWIKNFVHSNNLKVMWHSAKNDAYYKRQFDDNKTTQQEKTWVTTDKYSNNPMMTLGDAKGNLMKYEAGELTKKELEAKSPAPVVATAAVKHAINIHMTDLTPENYTDKYEAALEAAKRYFGKALGKQTKARQLASKGMLLTPKTDREIEELFNYYCPDQP